MSRWASRAWRPTLRLLKRDSVKATIAAAAVVVGTESIASYLPHAMHQPPAPPEISYSASTAPDLNHARLNVEDREKITQVITGALKALREGDEETAIKSYWTPWKTATSKELLADVDKFVQTVASVTPEQQEQLADVQQALKNPSNVTVTDINYVDDPNTLQVIKHQNGEPPPAARVCATVAVRNPVYGSISGVPENVWISVRLMRSITSPEEGLQVLDKPEQVLDAAGAITPPITFGKSKTNHTKSPTSWPGRPQTPTTNAPSSTPSLTRK